MEGWWLFSYVMMWVLLLVLVVLALAVLRQLGLLWVRVGGALGALQTGDAPRIGDPIPIHEVQDRSGVTRSLIPAEGLVKLVLFMSPTCEVCDSMIPHLPSFARANRKVADLLIVLTTPDRNEKFAKWSPKAPPIVQEPSLQDLFALPALPYAIAVGDDGRIASVGLVNDIIQLESVLNEALMPPPLDQSRGLQPLEPVSIEGAVAR